MRKTIVFITIIGFGGVLLLIVSCLIGMLFISSRPLIGVEEEFSPDWAPDGQVLAFECYRDGPTEKTAEGNRPHYTTEAMDICTSDINAHKFMHVTKDIGQDRYPVWEPSSSKIAYTRSDGIYIINPDGSNQRQLVNHNNALEAIGKVAWMPDGNKLLFAAQLENSEEDVYLVDVSTGIVTNLTLSNHRYDFVPIWTLDGTKIVFLSSNLSNPSLGQVPAQLRVINTNGSDERVIYNKEIYYDFVSVSNSGQIIFTTFDLAQDYLEHLYSIDLDGGKGPVEISALDRWLLLSSSPDGQYLVYGSLHLQVLDIETGKVQELPPTPNFHIEGIPRWSPDGQKIAVTGSDNPTGFYQEKHIYIFDLRNSTVQPLIQR